jgi:Zn ribbon nucleic-acid-binding protein
MDISKLKSGDRIVGLSCPKCKNKHSMRVLGTSEKRDNTHEIECLECMFSQWVNPKDFTLTYESKEEKEEREEVEKAEKEEKKNSKGRRR